jgi:hypothetical protein
LHGIAVRVASQYRRSARARYERLVQTESEDALQAAIGREVCAARSLDDAALRNKLEVALLELSAPQRDVFVLHELHERSMHEVAAELDIPLKTGFSRLYAARRALCESLRAAGVQITDAQSTELPSACRTPVGSWIGFGLAWAIARGSRIARAQLIATPKLAVTALSLACALLLQPADGIERLLRRSVQDTELTELAHAPFHAVRVDVLATATSTQPKPLAFARVVRPARPDPDVAAIHAPEAILIEAAPHASSAPAPAIDYEIYRAGALDLRPTIDSPLTPGTRSTRLAPRIRVREPSDPVVGLELAFASE